MVSFWVFRGVTLGSAPLPSLFRGVKREGGASCCRLYPACRRPTAAGVFFFFFGHLTNTGQKIRVTNQPTWCEYLNFYAQKVAALSSLCCCVCISLNGTFCLDIADHWPNKVTKKTEAHDRCRFLTFTPSARDDCNYFDVPTTYYQTTCAVLCCFLVCTLNRVIFQHRDFHDLLLLRLSPPTPHHHPCLLRLVWLWAHFDHFAKGPEHWRDKQRIHFKMYPQGRHPVRSASSLHLLQLTYVSDNTDVDMAPDCAGSLQSKAKKKKKKKQKRFPASTQLIRFLYGSIIMHLSCTRKCT